MGDPGNQERAYLVTPTCRERLSQGLPAGETRSGVRQRASRGPTPRRPEALGAPRSQDVAGLGAARRRLPSPVGK